MKHERTALLAVFNKEGIVDFAKGLIDLRWRLLASGGTAKYLGDNGVIVRDVAELAGGQPILGHRVVTLSRRIHAGLLARDTREDRRELERLGVPLIDLVCVDLYPLEQEISKAGSTLESVIEMTDVGGPTLLHAAAKGQRIVLCDAKDRPRLLDWLHAGQPDQTIIMERLAGKAELTVSAYIALAGAYRIGEPNANFIEGIRRALCGLENPFAVALNSVVSG